MRIRSTVLLLALLASVLVLPGLASATEATSTESTEGAATEDMAATEDTATEEATDEATEEAAAAEGGDSSTICDAEGLVAAVEGGQNAEGTLAGMADDPVGTAASNNPVLTTLVTAVQAAGLVDTLNSAEALTVFAPTDCAFAAVDPATLEAALADPSGLLTTVLGYHVIAGEQIASADLSGEYESFTGEALTVEGTTVAGQAEILVPDIMTANATVHLIDAVMLPPSVTEAAQATEAPASEPAATEEPAGDAATDAPADDAAATEAPPAGDASPAPSGGVATGAGGTAGGATATVLLIAGLLGVLALGGAVVARRAS
jgi:uncharacterized surface protein with fasciclin (FAS1) repeats